MSELAIRFTHRQTFGPDQSIEHTIDVEQIPPSNGAEKPSGAIALLSFPSTLGTLGCGVSFPTVLDTKVGHSKVLADGTQVPGTDPRTDHVAVIDHATGLMWTVESLGDEKDSDDGISQERCIDRCKALRLLGFDDWRLPSRTELAALVDDTRLDPAIDINLFPRVKPRWHWTSTDLAKSENAAAGRSASAWLVYFYYGYVDSYPRLSDGFALAVRRAGQ